jgi:hypothetical protein
MSQEYGFEILNLSPVTDGPFADVFGNTSIEDFVGGQRREFVDNG